MPARSCLFLVLAFLTTPALSRADGGMVKPDPRLLAEATHVVRGVVNALYSAETENEPGHVDSVYVIEIGINRSEKGEGPEAGGLLYARCWKSKRRPQGFAGPTGQTEIPAVGEQLFAYLKRNRDGGYDLLVPDGFRTFRPTTARGTRSIGPFPDVASPLVENDR